MRFQREAVSVEEAVLLLRESIPEPLGEERVSLYEAFGRTLAKRLIATHDLPPFTRSPLDGYAVRAEDTQAAGVDRPVWLDVVETVAAGEIPGQRVKSGTAIRIMTGAQMPEGANAVVMFEQTVNPGQVASRVGIKKAMKAGENLSLRGEEARDGAVIAEAGERINAGTMAILATFGYHQVPVVRAPRVGLLITGKELLQPEEPLVPGRIRNSNGAMLAGMVAEAGGIPVLFPPLPDDPAVCKAALDECLEQVDLIVTTGGVSVGDFDVITMLTEEADVKLLFNRVAMRPGSPTTALMYRNKPICSLSGNPGACYLGFFLFVRPMLARLLGQPSPTRRIHAMLGESFAKPCPYPRYLRGRLVEEQTVLVAYPDSNHKAGNLTTLKDTECFIIIPPGGRGRRSKEAVEVIPCGPWGRTGGDC